jgi:TatD DNase family protein
MKGEFFDSHCHVYHERMPGSASGALEAARAAGVTRLVTVGCDRETSLAAIEVAANNDDVWATVGLHPHEAVNGVTSITDLIENERVVAIGEAGLDFYYDHSPRDAQRTAFADQIQLAHTHALPLVVHTRDAWADTFDILEAEGTPDRTIFHCFTGGPDDARRCLDIGAFVSFSGIVTFKTATDVQTAAQLVPLDRMLIETDAPYLAPVPYRGRDNQPAYVASVAQFIADLRGIPIETIADETWANGSSAFQLIL